MCPECGGELAGVLDLGMNTIAKIITNLCLSKVFDAMILRQCPHQIVNVSPA